MVDCSEGPDMARYGTINPMLVTDQAYTNDANIDDVIAAVSDSFDSEAVVLTTPIRVENATIGITGFFSDTEIFIADANGAIRTFLYKGLMPDPEPVTIPTASPGMKVSFDVTEVQNFFGTREIKAIENVTVDTVIENESVYVQDGTANGGVDFDYATQGDQVFYMWGEVVADNGECGERGGITWRCYDLEYGDGKTVELRSANNEITGTGVCVQFVAPVGISSGAPQFNIDDFDWLTNQF